MLRGTYAWLRALDSVDAEYVRSLRNAPEVVQFFQYRHLINDLQQRRFVESLTEAHDRLFFIAGSSEDNQPLGVYFFKDIDHRNQRAEWGLFLDPQVQDRGEAAFEAACLLLDYGFGYLNLQKVFGEVLPENLRAIRFDEGLGMRLEGVRQRHVFYDNQFHDVQLYALFRDDFYQRPTRFVRAFRAQRRSRHTSPAPCPDVLQEEG